MDPVVMVPGLGSDGAVWQPTIDLLAPSIDCAVGDTLSDASLVAMAQRILDAAPPRFALAGVSMGGMVALEIMRAAPERVTRLFLCDTNAQPDTAEQASRRQAVNDAMLATDDLAKLAAPFIGYMVSSCTEQSVRDALTEMTLRVGATAYVRQNEAVIARGDLRPVLPMVTVPTMIVVGEHDVMTPPSFSEAISESIFGSTLHIVQNCGHLPPIEKPREVAALLRELLARA